MEKTLQKKFKQETREYFLKIGYQQLLQASFNAKEFDDMAAQIAKNDAQIETNDAEIRILKARLDHHSVENRTEMKMLEETNSSLRQTSRAIKPVMESLNTETQQFTYKGMRYLKMAEYCESFEMADKKS